MITTWEYRMLSNATHSMMNEFGAEGWELVAISQTNKYIFKRPQNGPVTS